MIDGFPTKISISPPLLFHAHLNRRQGIGMSGSTFKQNPPADDPHSNSAKVNLTLASCWQRNACDYPRFSDSFSPLKVILSEPS
jgi:hypothetical protein